MLVLLYHFSKRSKGIYKTMFTLQFYSIHILSSNVYSCKPVYLRSYSFSTLVDLMIKHSEKKEGCSVLDAIEKGATSNGGDQRWRNKQADRITCVLLFIH